MIITNKQIEKLKKKYNFTGFIDEENGDIYIENEHGCDIEIKTQNVIIKYFIITETRFLEDIRYLEHTIININKAIELIKELQQILNNIKR